MKEESKPCFCTATITPFLLIGELGETVFQDVPPTGLELSVPKIHTGLKLTILLLLLLLFLVCWNYKHEPGISNIFSKNLLQFIYEMLLRAHVLEHLFPSWWHCLRKLWNLWNVGFADRHRPLGLVLRVTAWPCS